MRLRERTALREDATTLLGELGDTAGEVAMSLCWLGIQILPSSAGRSPAARYLHAVVGADDRVKRVTVTKRWLVLKTHRRWWSTIWLRLPKPVREFSISVDAARPNIRRKSHSGPPQRNGDRRSEPIRPGQLWRNLHGRLAICVR
jgi:hypothetical protein